MTDKIVNDLDQELSLELITDHNGGLDTGS